MLMGVGLAVASLTFGQVVARYTSDVSSFSVQFPGAVEESKSVVSWNSGQLTSTVYSSQTGMGLYRVAVTQLPREVIRSKSAQELLDAARDGSLTMNKMTVDAEQKLLVNGAPGRRYIVKTPDAPNVVHLVVIANGRLYQASAAVPDQELSRGVNFVKSFSLNMVVNVGG
jgi:hypothetical protein